MLSTTEVFFASEAAYRQDRIRGEFRGRTVRRPGRRDRASGRSILRRRHSVATSH